MGARELFDILESRRKQKLAVEFFDTEAADSDNEDERLQNGKGHDCIRLRSFRYETVEGVDYAVGLVEFIDTRQKSFSVVSMATYAGRDLEGDPDERGAATAHFVVRLPSADDYDDGKYRIAIESVHGVTRSDIEVLFCRQLRRYANAEKLEFTVTPKKKGKPKNYRYTPRLELAADVGRKLKAGNGAKVLTHMVFTHRNEKQNTSRATDVVHQDFYADVEMRVSAQQGPVDPEEKISWAEGLKQWFLSRGYEGRFYFRHADGGRSSGKVLTKDLAGATDLLMCPRETIHTDAAPKPWVSRISPLVFEAMRNLLERDELWERSE